MGRFSRLMFHLMVGAVLIAIFTRVGIILSDVNPDFLFYGVMLGIGAAVLELLYLGFPSYTLDRVRSAWYRQNSQVSSAPGCYGTITFLLSLVVGSLLLFLGADTGFLGVVLPVCCGMIILFILLVRRLSASTRDVKVVHRIHSLGQSYHVIPIEMAATYPLGPGKHGQVIGGIKRMSSYGLKGKLTRDRKEFLYDRDQYCPKWVVPDAFVNAYQLLPGGFSNPRPGDRPRVPHLRLFTWKSVFALVVVLLFFLWVIPSTLGWLGDQELIEWQARYSQNLAFSEEWNGMSIFREGLEDEGFQVRPLYTSPQFLLDLDPATHSNRLLIIAGVEDAYNEDDLLALEEFYEAGGKILLMEDQGSGDEVAERLTAGELSFTRRQVVSNTFVRNNAFIPVSTSLGTVITDEPTLGTGNPTEVYGAYDGNARQDANDNGFRDPEDDPADGWLVSRAGARLVLIADSSLFINELVQPLDIDGDGAGDVTFANYELGVSLVKLLLPDGGEIVFDESRHTQHGPFGRVYHQFHTSVKAMAGSGCFYIPSIIVFLVILGFYRQSRRRSQERMKGEETYFDVSPDPKPIIARHLNVRLDAEEVRDILIEKIREESGALPEEFETLKREMYTNLFPRNPEVVQFLLGSAASPDWRQYQDMIIAAITAMGGYKEVDLKGGGKSS